MAKEQSGTQFTDAEIYTIKSLYKRVPTAEIARKLGRSYSGVRKVIESMKDELGEPATKTATERPEEPLQGSGTLGKLHALESLLWDEIRASEGPTTARLASEYRATLLEIERREEAGTDSADESDVLGKLADAFISRAGKA